jgi:tRNA-dihydrouridine synthase A
MQVTNLKSPTPSALRRRICVAPMMDWTDRHDRYFLRQISAHALLYTEMVTAEAILRGDRELLLRHDPSEHPLGLQLGGSQRDQMVAAARIGEGFGYAEININVGCPSDRVLAGRFGACLMREPELVAECYTAMTNAVSVPITVKCRIGVDDQDPEHALPRFIETVSAAGCSTFIVHARKALLVGLTPKQNREIPPLDHDLVHRVKRAYPHLEIIINGGIETLDQTEDHLAHVDGVMLGRAAYQTPWVLADVDRRFFGATGPAPNRWQVVEEMVDYARARRAERVPLKSITRHMLGLFQGLPGARSWRRFLSENANEFDAAPELLRQAADLVIRERERAA